MRHTPACVQVEICGFLHPPRYTHHFLKFIAAAKVGVRA